MNALKTINYKLKTLLQNYKLKTLLRNDKLKTLLFAVLALATLCGNFPTIRKRVRLAIEDYPDTLSRLFNCLTPIFDEQRALVRAHLPAGESLYLFEPLEEGLTPLLRLHRIALAWEVMPGKVVSFSKGSVPPRMDLLATSVYEGKLPVKDDGGWVPLNPGGEGPVWVRRGRGEEVLKFESSKVLKLENSEALKLENSQALEFEHSKVLEFENSEVLELENSEVLKLEHSKALKLEGGVSPLSAGAANIVVPGSTSSGSR